MATARLTRLLTADRITEPARTAAQERLEAAWAARTGTILDPQATTYRSPAAYVLSCPWCMSIWVAAGIVTALSIGGHPPEHPILLTLAASTVAGLLAGLGDSGGPG